MTRDRDVIRGLDGAVVMRRFMHFKGKDVETS